MDHAVGSRNVNEQVLGLLGDRRQLAIDDRRKREHLIFSVHNERITLATLQDMAVALALGVLLQHLLHAHLFGKVQRHELSRRIFPKVAEGRRDTREVMHADGHLASISAQPPVQILLQAHERLNGLAGEGKASHHGAADNGAHRFYRLLYLQDDRPFLDVILHQSRL